MGTNAVSRLTAYLKYTAGAKKKSNLKVETLRQIILETLRRVTVNSFRKRITKASETFYARRVICCGSISLLRQYFIVVAVFLLLWQCVRVMRGGICLSCRLVRPRAPIVAIQAASEREGN